MGEGGDAGEVGDGGIPREAFRLLLMRWRHHRGCGDEPREDPDQSTHVYGAKLREGDHSFEWSTCSGWNRAGTLG